MESMRKPMCRSSGLKPLKSDKYTKKVKEICKKYKL